MVEGPANLEDGTAVRVDVLSGNAVVPGALAVPVVAIRGTAAESKLLDASGVIQCHALIRMRVPAILVKTGTPSGTSPGHCRGEAPRGPRGREARSRWRGERPTRGDKACLANLSGAARAAWKHSLPPVDALRYSISFRTLRLRPEAGSPL